MLLPILIAVGVGIGLGVLYVVISLYVNSRVNNIQRVFNKVENKLDAAGAEWLSDVLEDAIVGDAHGAYVKLKMLIEAKDTEEFFLKNVAVPLGQYAIRQTARDYPDMFNLLVNELKMVMPGGGVKDAGGNEDVSA